MGECRICNCRYTAAMTCPNCDHDPHGARPPKVTPDITVEVLDIQAGPRRQRDDDSFDAVIDRLYRDQGGEGGAA